MFLHIILGFGKNVTNDCFRGGILVGDGVEVRLRSCGRSI